MIYGTQSPDGRKSLRSKALLGTALAAVLGAALLGGTALLPDRTAVADPVSVQPVQAPSFADLAAKVAPAVVSIRVDENAQVANTQDFFSGPNGPIDPFQGLPDNSPLRRFFGGPNQNQNPQQGQPNAVALGSGFFISDNGYVVTNNHVVDNASNFTVITNDGTQYKASLVGKDSKSDLAVLKVDANRKFTYVTWAKDTPRVGDWVVAVGNPFGLGGTVTAGIVSAEGRQIDNNSSYEDYLQIDAPVNRGNSGGPTFNTSGEVVGINTAIYSPSGGSVGIGFDIPASVAAPIIASLEAHGTVVRGWLGVQIQPVDQNIADSLKLPDTNGALVADAQSGGPAADAGIMAGDVILSVDGKAIDKPVDLALQIAEDQPNSNVDVTVWRNGQKQDIQVKLGTLPSDQQAAAQAFGNGQGQHSNGNTSQDTVLSGLGLTVAPSPNQNGVVVASVDPNGAAGNAGLSTGDQILSVGDTMVASTADVQKAVDAAKQSGLKAVLMRVRSGQNTEFVAIPLA
jgi:serine protease Do